MASFHLLFIQLLALASAAAGFSTITNPSLRTKMMASYKSTTTRSMNLLHKSQEDGHDGGDSEGDGNIYIGKNIQQSIRPVIFSAVVVASSSILASSTLLPIAAHADSSVFDTENHLVTTIYPESISSSAVVASSSSSYTTSYYSPSATMMVMPSSLELSSSSLANPIGELKDGSGNTSIATSFGQWFTLLYVVVSLLAGGKEVLRRIQKQMYKDEGP